MATPGYSFTININLLAEALLMPEQDCVDEFRDGRVASRFTEHWAARIFGFKRHRRDHPGSDGYYVLPEGDEIRGAVRTLTESGIKFQDSKYIGSGRSCSQQDLTRSIRNTDMWIVFDIRNFPIVEPIKVRTSILEYWIEQGDLTTAGLSAVKFAMLLNRDACPQYRQLQFN